MKSQYTVIVVLLALLSYGTASAKLPPPSEETKAKAAEAAAKSAHGGKVAAYQLCKSQDKVAADYFAAAQKSGTQVTPAVATPACVEPGPFVYSPPQAAPAPEPKK